MNELMKKYKSNIKVVSFEIMKSSKPHKINPSCSRFCGLFVLNIYVCKVIVVFLSVSCSSIYSNMPSDLNTLGSLPDFDTLEFVFEHGHFVFFCGFDILCSFSKLCTLEFVFRLLFFEFVIGIEYTSFVFGFVNSAYMDLHISTKDHS